LLYNTDTKSFQESQQSFTINAPGWFFSKNISGIGSSDLTLRNTAAAYITVEGIS